MSETAVDFALVEQFRKRDPQAVEALYDRFGPLVYSLFYRITRNPSVAEDLVQELFIRIWNRAEEFDASRGSLGVWILSVARHMGIDHLRSAQTRFGHRLQPLEAAGQMPLNAHGADTMLDQSRAVEAAFSILSERHKQMLELAYFEGLSHREIAERIGEPLGTVKSWLRAALQSLRSATQSSRKSSEGSL